MARDRAADLQSFRQVATAREAELEKSREARNTLEGEADGKYQRTLQVKS